MGREFQEFHLNGSCQDDKPSHSLTSPTGFQIADGQNYLGLPFFMVDALAHLHGERRPFRHNSEEIPGKIAEYLGERLLACKLIQRGIHTGEKTDGRLHYAAATKSRNYIVDVRANGSKVLCAKPLHIWNA